MADMIVPEYIKSSEICAVIIRKDGKVEDLGRISYYNRNIFKRWWWGLKKFMVDKINSFQG